MSLETAKQSGVHAQRKPATTLDGAPTFFGGETLMNLPVLKRDDYLRQAARRRSREGCRFQPDDQRHAAEAGGHQYLVENRVGVTISFDGPPEVQNKFRVFNNGTGSYDIVAPKIKGAARAAQRRGRSGASRSPRGATRTCGRSQAPHRGVWFP